MQCNSTFTPASTDLFAFNQNIEADAIGDINFGIAGALSMALTFWVYSSTTGTFSGSLQNAAATRSYVFTYVISVASTWTKITLIVPGDTAGTWVNSGNVAALVTNFDMGSGSNLRTASINTWIAGNYVGQTGSVAPANTLNVRWGVTGVKLEVGSVASPFIFDPLPVRTARCQRYFCKSYDLNTQPGTATFSGMSEIQVPQGGTGGLLMTSFFPVKMRADPSVKIYSTGGGINLVSIGSDVSSHLDASNEVCLTAGYSGSTNCSFMQYQWTASAEI
jgi:hypothetical protein